MPFSLSSPLIFILIVISRVHSESTFPFADTTCAGALPLSVWVGRGAAWSRSRHSLTHTHLPQTGASQKTYFLPSTHPLLLRFSTHCCCSMLSSGTPKMECLRRSTRLILCPRLDLVPDLDQVLAHLRPWHAPLGGCCVHLDLELLLCIVIVMRKFWEKETEKDKRKWGNKDGKLWATTKKANDKNLDHLHKEDKKIL